MSTVARVGLKHSANAAKTKLQLNKTKLHETLPTARAMHAVQSLYRPWRKHILIAASY